MNEIVVMVAPNGARKTRLDHAAIPLTPEELAETAESCLAAGASAMHLHVRDDDGGHSLDADRYRAALDAVRSRVGDDLLLQVTTEAVGIYSAEQQIAVVRDLVPEAVSLSVRELDRAGESAIGEFDRWMKEAGVLPQWILYSNDDLVLFNDWVECGVLAGDAYPVLFVLGKYNPPVDATPAMLDAFTRDVGQHAWMACAFGPAEAEVLQAAAALGGHARIGFENNLLGADGAVAVDNASQVGRLVESVQSTTGRSPATAAQARELLTPHW